jgi:hypothetical protein
VLPVSEAALEEIAIEFLEAHGIATTKMGIGADNASNGWFLNVLCICQVAVFFSRSAFFTDIASPCLFLT